MNLQGLWHVTGAERSSPYRLACQLAAASGLSLGAVRWAWSSAETADCSNETSLSSRRARRSLDMPMPMLREGLQCFAEQATSGWRERSRLADHAPVRGQAA